MQDFPDAQAKVSTTCCVITALARIGIFTPLVFYSAAECVISEAAGGLYL
jgi:hypothetical protein